MFGLNRQVKSTVQPQAFNRQPAVEMKTKILAIAFGESNRLLFDCTHLGTLSKDEVLVLNPKDVKKDAAIDSTATKNLLSSFSMKMLTYFQSKKNEEFNDPSIREQFLSVVSKSCTNVKSIDFINFELPDGFFVELVQSCPELECLKMDGPVVKEDDWKLGLEQIGQKIIHFEATPTGMWPKEKIVSVLQRLSRLIAIVGINCANIKQVTITLDWLMGWNVTGELSSAFKKLPKSCWIKLSCNKLNEKTVDKAGHLFEDVVNDLFVHALYWSLLKPRYKRLSKLVFFDMYETDGHSVDFVNLKFLEIINILSSEDVSCLVASNFPRLEEFVLNVNGMTEANYNTLFQKMPSLKKLAIDYDYKYGQASQLPRLSIMHLSKIETISITIVEVGGYWQPKAFLKQIGQYVYDIRSLKTLTVNPKGISDLWKKSFLVSRVIQMKQKQSRVEVDIV